MSDELVTYRLDRGIAWITLNAPERRNALTTAMMTRLSSLLQTADEDDAVRVVVLGHAGTAFCAGIDLGSDTPPVQAFPSLLSSLLAVDKPVVARVGGAARAGGIGLLAACDLAVAARSATFAFSEVRVGVVPAVISAVVLPRLAPAAARELFLTGEVFDGVRAASIGLVTTAVDDVDAAVASYVDSLLLGGPTALAGIKALFRDDLLSDRLAALAVESAQWFAGDEGREGMAAFREKRRPRWVP